MSVVPIIALLVGIALLGVGLSKTAPRDRRRRGDSGDGGDGWDGGDCGGDGGGD